MVIESNCNGIKISRNSIEGIISEYTRLKKEETEGTPLYYIYDQHIEHYNRLNRASQGGR